MDSYLEDLESGTGTVKASVQEVHQLSPIPSLPNRAWADALEHQLRIYLEDAYLYVHRYTTAPSKLDPNQWSLPMNPLLGMNP